MKLLIVLMAAAAACNSQEPAPTAGSGPTASARPAAPPAPKPAPAPTTGSDDVDHKRSTAENNMTGLRPHQAANCPAGLPGSETRIAMTPHGIDVTVTSKDARTIRRIIKLAELHTRARTAEKPRPHDTRHGGPGTIGYCPIIANDMTVLSMTIIGGGALVHVNARSPLRVQELQELVKARAARLPGYLSS
jgi:hypothetical protein